MKRPLSEFSAEPLFTIRVVEQQTGIAAVTLRAWEKHYHFLPPHHTRSGLRLYSAQDVALLRWVREQMIAGLTISRVAAILAEKRRNQEEIWVESLAIDRPSPRRAPPPPADLITPLYKALMALETRRVNQLLNQASATYSVTEVIVDIILPTVHRVGRHAPSRPGLTIPAHSAINYLRGTVFRLLQATPQLADAPHLLIGCAPGEYHEIGGLSFAALAGQAGYRVSYLGQDIPVSSLIAALSPASPPAMVIMTATLPESALRLAGMETGIRQATDGKTVLGYAGRAFETDPTLKRQVAGTYLGSDHVEGITLLEELLPPER